nr:MAG TPA_asm: hypothetical protein [Caudoviricetes sp.]
MAGAFYSIPKISRIFHCFINLLPLIPGGIGIAIYL